MQLQITDAVRTELLAFAADLVRIRSYSGHEEEIVRFIAGHMRQLGFADVRIDGFGNVVGRLGEGPRSIMFDSHIDTVEVLDADQWEQPPFGGLIVDGNLWGRGSVDMKSGAAASIYAATLAHKLGYTEGKTVWVTCTALEEDCDGENLAHMFRELSLRPDLFVTCEPSSNVITTGHKGKAQMVIEASGVSAHGSAPEKGVNAIYEMAEIIQRVEQTNLRLAAQPAPRGTLVMSRISSSSVSLNAVPFACEAYLDRRMALGETRATIQREMDAIVAGKSANWAVGTLRRRTWTGLDLTYEPMHLAWQVAHEHKLTQAFVGAYAETYGFPPRSFDFWDFSTNAVTPVKLGIPSIGFGPGEYKLAHMRNEHCPVQQIVDACAVYARAIRNL
jgi:putative selenium metabolism hydrolase